MADNAKSTSTTTTTATAKKADEVKSEQPGNHPQPSGFGVGENEVNANAPVERLEEVQVDEDQAEELRKSDSVPVYNLHAGLAPRVGGPYLDLIELENAERRRAVVEDREPDFSPKGLGAGSAGVPLVPAGVLVNAHVNSVNAPAVIATLVEENADNRKVGPTPLGEVDAVGMPENGLSQAVTKNILTDADKITSHDNQFLTFSDGQRNTEKISDAPPPSRNK